MPKPRSKTQIAKFKEAARAIKADLPEGQFNSVLKRVARADQSAGAKKTHKRSKSESQP